MKMKVLFQLPLAVVVILSLLLPYVVVVVVAKVPTTTPLVSKVAMTLNAAETRRSNKRQFFVPPFGTTTTTATTVADNDNDDDDLEITTRSMVVPAGGSSCSDSNPILMLKITLSALMETITMFGWIIVCKVLASQMKKTSSSSSSSSSSLSSSSSFPLFPIPTICGLSLIQWISLVTVIFCSSFFGSIVDGGVSAATNQVLDPNRIPGDPHWYSKLQKPWWNPPGWVFPIMWLLISKPTQLIAVWKVLTSDGTTTIISSKWEGKLPALESLCLFLYCAHLSVGDAWNKVFFGLQRLGQGAAVITFFFGLLLTTTIFFYSFDPMAGLFMLPTCAWVSVATALNWNIYLTNKK